MNHCQVGIIGAGPSGITVAIQLTRYGISNVLIEGKQTGGLLRNANWVENYPGFPNGISGEDLADLMTSQMENSSVTMIFDTVNWACWEGDQFILSMRDDKICCPVLIIASGTRAIHLPEGIVHPLAEKFVYYEIDHLPQINQAQIAIIGGGDAAFDYALHLCARNQVTIYQRKLTARCLPLLMQRATSSSNINIFTETQVESIKRQEDNRLILTLQRNRDRLIHQADYVLVAIGRRPNLEFLDPKLLRQIDKLEQSQCCFRIGDVNNGFLRQTAIAVGDGMRAAMQIAQTIQEVDL